MKLQLSGPSNQKIESKIQVTGSKSESNRLLLLQALFPNIKIENISNSDDAVVMAKGLGVSHGLVDIHHAGTAMRFLTSYFASQPGKQVTLTGSKRMTERPIKVLVEALCSLGADITYENNEGYPPIRIRGKQLAKNKARLPANISSQYISSLLLVAPSLDNGLELELVGAITSVPYIKMTLALLDDIGVVTSFQGNIIKVDAKKSVRDTTLTVESDWSSASYFYSIVSLSKIGTEITLTSYKEHSLQGDSVLADIYVDFGVQTTYDDKNIILKKVADCQLPTIECQLQNAPDIAQTIAVSCFGLGLGCELTGLHTLKIKETDRLEALHTELSKLGADILVTDNTLSLKPSAQIRGNEAIATYNDHRMAMAFAPLALKTTLYIEDADVVSKSYPDFWEDLKKLQFKVTTV